MICTTFFKCIDVSINIDNENKVIHVPCESIRVHKYADSIGCDIYQAQTIRVDVGDDGEQVESRHGYQDKDIDCAILFLKKAR
jgi:hypothetical protein